MLELLAGACLAGAAIGCGTGLIPGLHPNTVAAVLAGTALLAPVPGAVLLVAAATTHTFLNVVPSLVLGVGDPSAMLTVLPGHELVRQGAGEDAVLHSATGSLLGLLGAAALVPLVAVAGTLPVAVPYRTILLVALSGLTAYLIASEQGPIPIHRTVVPAFDGIVPPGEDPVGIGEVSDPDVQVQGRVADVDGDVLALDTDQGRRRVEDVRGWARRPDPGDEVVVHGRARWRPGPGARLVAPLAALGVFALAAALGAFASTLSLVGVLGPATPLLPLLTGLFGGGTLLTTGREAAAERQMPGVDPDDAAAVRWSLPGILAGGLVAALPGVTAAQGTAVATLGRRRDPKALVTTISAVNSAAVVLTLAVLVAFDRVRSGVAHALSTMPRLPGANVLLAAAVVAGGIGFAVTRLLGRRLIAWAPLLARPAASRIVLGAIGVLVLALTGPVGVALLAVASAVGTVPPRLGVRRIHLMGALLGPLLWGLWTV